MNFNLMFILRNMDFSSLPANVLVMVQDIVFDYENCSLEELTNLCRVSKAIYHDVMPYIYCDSYETCFTLTCKCSRQLQSNDIVYLCKPFSAKQSFSFDWRCMHCTLSSNLNKRLKGLGKGGKKIHSYGLIEVYEPNFRMCNAIIRKDNGKFRFCNSTNCCHLPKKHIKKQHIL